MSQRTLIIGGGAAGMTAAVISARKGDKTLLMEQNARLGKKLRITGKGRCNLTNACGRDELTKNITRNPRFLYSAFSKYDNAWCVRFFEELGVPLKTERGGRVFPVSDRADDVADALEREIGRLGAEITRKKATGLAISDGKILGAETDGGIAEADKVILATGGASYRATGSDGGGYEIARAAGHNIITPMPGLVPLVTEEYCGDMKGLTVKNAVMTLIDNKTGKAPFSRLGEFTFEEYGIGGPLTLTASCFMESAERDAYSVSIDLKPALDRETLDRRILREISDNGGGTARELMKTLLPESLVPTVLKRAGTDPAAKNAEISKAQRKALRETLKDLRFTIRGFRDINEALITRGGVDVREVDPKTMESRIVKGLRFAGEILDVSGLTGGFNLQIAFSTAAAAAE